MSYGYRLQYAALVGWLTIVVIGSPCAAQNVPVENPSTVNFTKESPAGERVTHPKSDNKNDRTSNLPTPLSVRIGEDPVESDPSRNREKTADQREAENLQLQRDSTKAAERSADIAERAYWQNWGPIALGLIGFPIIAWSLVVSIRASTTATKAVEVFVQSERPVLFPGNAKIERRDADVFHVFFDILNYGRTVAFPTGYTANESHGGKVITEFRGAMSRPISAGGCIKFTAPFVQVQIDDGLRAQIQAGREMFITGEIRYRDNFGKRWASKFKYEFIIKEDGSEDIVWIDDGWRDEEDDGKKT